MAASSFWPFQCPSTHETISTIIRRRSTNSTDVREIALCDLDLSFAKDILDLGCGFGFMAETLAKRVAPDARLVGVDTWGANEAPFLEKIAAAGRRGRFICMQLASRLPWPNRSFDLVVCSYSLYYFVDILSEVTRILTPHGLFVTLTHTESSMVSLLRSAGLDHDAGSELLTLTGRFSAENGGSLLKRWFGEVTRIDYQNSLRFEAGHIDELLTYFRFKQPLLIPDSQPGDDLPEAVAGFAGTLLSRGGEVVIEKNDTAFQCRRPLCP